MRKEHASVGGILIAAVVQRSSGNRERGQQCNHQQRLLRRNDGQDVASRVSGYGVGGGHDSQPLNLFVWLAGQGA